MPPNIVRPPRNDYSIPDIAGFWLRAGGDAAAVVKMTATSWYESDSGDSNAVSSADCIGLWQICAFHAAEFNVQYQSFFDPAFNAYAAVVLSNNGRNLAPWDACYANLTRAAQRYPIDYPEQGSPVYNLIGRVNAELGGTGGGGAGYPSGPTQEPPSGGGAPGAGAPGQTGGAGPYIPPPPQQGQGGGYQGIPTISVPWAQGSGWDNLRQYGSNDQQQLYNYYQTISRMLGGSFG